MKRDLKAHFLKVPAALIKLLKKVPEPSFINPMLATLTKNYFSSKEWLYEHKFDGERCLAFKKNGSVNLISRNNKKMNDIYPELVAALAQQTADNFIIDGEIISLNKKGISDFELLQGRINVHEKSKVIFKQQDITIIYCIFDLMYSDGYDIRALPLYARKELLEKLLDYNKILTYTNHRIGDGISYFKEACTLGWEGLIAKRIMSKYTGTRSTDWLKFKCIMKQELVIGGYTNPKGSRSDFGALLVGYYEKGLNPEQSNSKRSDTTEKLIYAGKVGTGYSQETLSLLGKKLQKLEIKKCPFDNYNRPTKDIHWVQPLLVAEFQFAQWTNAGRLRVGRYKGLRDDKNAQDVIKEVPQSIGPENNTKKG